MGRRMNINYSKLCLLILACTIAYNEYGAYWVCHARWPRLPSLDGDQVINSAANRLIGEVIQSGAFYVIVQPVVEPMDRFAALLMTEC